MWVIPGIQFNSKFSVVFSKQLNQIDQSKCEILYYLWIGISNVQVWLGKYMHIYTGYVDWIMMFCVFK